MRMRPEPVPSVKRAWTCSLQIPREEFTLHVVAVEGGL
jgi:hypothetical protein